MENNVTSLSVSKKLKEAGFKIKKQLIWVKYDDGSFGLSNRKYFFSSAGEKYNPLHKTEHYNAYQVNELLAELPHSIRPKDKSRVYLEPRIGRDNYSVCYHLCFECPVGTQKADTLQDTLALMWIWLKENGYSKEKS